MDRTGLRPVQILALKLTAFQASLKTKAKGRGFQAIGGPTWLTAKQTGRGPHGGDCVGRSRPITAQQATHLAPRGALGRFAPVGGSRGVGVPRFGVFEDGGFWIQMLERLIVEA